MPLTPVPARRALKPPLALQGPQGPAEGCDIEGEEFAQPPLRHLPGQVHDLEQCELSRVQAGLPKLAVIRLRDGAAGSAQARARARENRQSLVALRPFHVAHDHIICKYNYRVKGILRSPRTCALGQKETCSVLECVSVASTDGKRVEGGPYRTLVFVRHGQFSASTLSLTPLGRKQAACAAQRLRAFPVTRIHCSTMKRAYETALIIAKRHQDRPPIRSHLLRECLPSLPKHWRTRLAVSIETIRRGKDQADRAYQRHFMRPVTRNECELLVCHGNVIRYLVGRALGFRKHGWHQLGSSHCGITIVRVSGNGDVSLERYNDTGHLPAEWSTT